MNCVFQFHAIKTSERRLSAAIDNAHAFVFEVLRQSREFGLPQFIGLVLREFWPMLTKPVIFPIGRSAAIHAEQNDGVSTPEVSQIDGLITTVAALVDDVIFAKPRLVL